MCVCATETLVHALGTSRVGSNNVLYMHGLPATQLDRIQSIPKIAARLLCKAHKGVASQTLLKSLRWPPNRERIRCKVLLLTFKVLHSLALHIWQTYW